MANSSVDIANIALRLLGEPPIVSFTGTQKAQVLCAQDYPYARDEVFMVHPWSICTKRKALNEYDEEPNLTDYAYTYVVPADCLRLLAIRPTSVSSVGVTALSGYLDDFSARDSSSYLLEGGVIYSNAESAYAQYLARVENPAVLPGYLVDAIAANLAKRIAYAMTQNASVAQFAAQNYFNTLQLAMQQDARGQRNTPSPPTQWNEVF